VRVRGIPEIANISRVRRKGPVALWGKKPQSAIYEVEPGIFLFVPTDDIWLVLEVACKLGTSCVGQIVRAAVRPPEQQKNPKNGHYSDHVSAALLRSWLNKHHEHAWLRGWLLNGEPPPVHVTIATGGQVSRCQKAWGFMSRCHHAGVAPNTYHAWIRKRMIPDLRLLKWLYGAPAPKEVFVVNPRLQKLRSEMSLDAIIRAAGLRDRENVQRWKRDSDLYEVLKEAFHLVSSCSARPLASLVRTVSQIRAGGICPHS
jgi:hypothetical protein